VNQRLVKAALNGEPCPYPIGDPVPDGAPLKASDATLEQIAEKTNRSDKRMIDVALQIQHSMAAFSLQEQIGRVFASKVSGSNAVGSFVSMDGVPGADGFVYNQKLSKGDPVSVRIDSVDIEKGCVRVSLVDSPPQGS
ncbi:MAG: hypothetical protein ACYCW6_14720, partial [Candidatus Xenobia bacterium]